MVACYHGVENTAKPTITVFCRVFRHGEERDVQSRSRTGGSYNMGLGAGDVAGNFASSGSARFRRKRWLEAWKAGFKPSAIFPESNPLVL